jgi:alpha-L-glutamate ligase-like protein
VIFRGLREAGVLGLNARNSEIIARYNARENYPRVDDKLQSKQLAIASGIAAPRLIGVITDYGDITHLRRLLTSAADFALKPVKGAQGNGVLVVERREGDDFVQADGTRLSVRDLEHHVASILAGMHSLGGHVDRAMFEERLQTDPTFERIALGGVPDIRVIVFRGVPIMAMVRLPTRASRGRANLHQGAIAAGIDLATGTTLEGTHKDRPAKHHPDTGVAIAGHVIPRWHALLTIAARCADAFELGYLGVDLVLDARHGPVLLEANARPGLSIQLANGRGLWPRLHAVEPMTLAGVTAEERVAIGRALR